MRLEKLKKYEIKELLENMTDIIQFNDGLFEALMSYRLSKKYGIRYVFTNRQIFYFFQKRLDGIW